MLRYACRLPYLRDSCSKSFCILLRNEHVNIKHLEPVKELYRHFRDLFVIPDRRHQSLLIVNGDCKSFIFSYKHGSVVLQSYLIYIISIIISTDPCLLNVFYFLKAGGSPACPALSHARKYLFQRLDFNRYILSYIFQTPCVQEPRPWLARRCRPLP